jgi:hypothetical protein
LIASTLFHNPMQISWLDQLWFLLPLCVAVAIVYKTIRSNNLRRLPLEILALVGYMLAGLTALGGGMWLLQSYWP